MAAKKPILTLNITAEVSEECGGDYDLRIESHGEYEVTMDVKAGVDLMPLLQQKLYNEFQVDYAWDIRISSLRITGINY